MVFLNKSGNPFDYMSSLWTVMVVVLAVCGILILVLRPLHKIWTDRKTRAIIEESGGPAPTPPGPEHDSEDGPDDEGDRKK